MTPTGPQQSVLLPSDAEFRLWHLVAHRGDTDPRDSVRFDEFAQRMGVSHRSWVLTYSRARAAGDPRAIGRDREVA